MDCGKDGKAKGNGQPMVFEQGPIRPPSEASSLLLRFTRNCPWNQCTFCGVYKKRPFSRRSLEEICRDIDAVHAILEELKTLSHSMGQGGALTRPVLNAVFTSGSYSDLFRHVAVWAYTGNGTVFIQDANSLVLSADVFARALRYLKERVPGIRRITSYGRSSTIARKSLDELKEIRAAGLNQIHIGLESGSDEVLKRIKKGTTGAEHIEAGRKVVEAGMSLSEYVMPGLGGQELSREHALETARVLNAIDPHFIRLRSLRVPPRTPLYQEKVAGKFTLLSDDDTVREIRLFIASLDGIRSTVASDHFMNLLPQVDGKLPQDKEAMLAVIDRYLDLPPEERQLYRLGRRGGAIQGMDDLRNPSLRARLEQARRDLQAQTGSSLEEVITQLGDQYV